LPEQIEPDLCRWGLLSFRRPPDEHHRWATKSPGWIDYAFLGNGSRSQSISETINERARKDGSGVFYEPEQDGGRYLPDGKLLEWLISAPRQEGGITATPFFCGDVTPRYLRVCVYLVRQHSSFRVMYLAR
jgi:hypothetical protein